MCQGDGEEVQEGDLHNTLQIMKIKNALTGAATALIAASVINGTASAATVTYQQTRQCTNIPAQAARTAGFIRVGNQSQIINVGPTDAYRHCSWSGNGNSRTVTHTVPSRYSDH